MLTTINGKIDSNTIIVGDFNTPLTPMDRSCRQKINKETQASNDTLDQLDLIDVYMAFQPKAISSVQFSSVGQSCPTLCDPMNHSTPDLPVHHQLPEFTQTHVH